MIEDGAIYNGNDFNKLVKLNCHTIPNINGRFFFRIMNSTHIHYNFEYKVGLNIMDGNILSSDLEKGFYATTLNHVFKWLQKGSEISPVSIPDDSHVQYFSYWETIRSCKFIIHDFIPLATFFDNNKELRSRAIIDSKGYAIRYLHNITRDECTLAQKVNPWIKLLGTIN